MAAAVLGFVLAMTVGPAPAVPVPELREVALAVVDEQGRPVSGLQVSDVALIENGQARDVARLEPDTRPLHVLLLVDSSAELEADFRLYFVPAALRFARALPAGTRLAVWRSGDRPAMVSDYSDDRVASATALKRTFPQGGNTLFDALVEAGRESAAPEGARRAAVVLTGLTTNFSNRGRQRALDEARALFDSVSALLVEQGQADFSARADYDFVLGRLARDSGGLVERTLSGMGAETGLERLAGDLAGRYRLVYAAGAGDGRASKLEVHVARPGTKVRVLPAPPAAR